MNESIADFVTRITEPDFQRLRDLRPLKELRQLDPSAPDGFFGFSVTFDYQTDYHDFERVIEEIRQEILKKLSSSNLDCWKDFKVLINLRTHPRRLGLPMTDREIEEDENQTYGRADIEIHLFSK